MCATLEEEEEVEKEEEKEEEATNRAAPLLALLSPDPFESPVRASPQHATLGLSFLPSPKCH